MPKWDGHSRTQKGSVTKYFDFLKMKQIEYSFVVEFMKRTRPAISVDIGCGNGALAAYLNSIGFDTYGVDLLPMDKADRIEGYQGYQLDPSKFRQEDGSKLSFPDKTFDLVFSLGTVKAMGLGSYKEPKEEGKDRKAVLEFGRILKDDGRMIISLAFGEPGVRERATPFRAYDEGMVERLIEGFEATERIYYYFDRITWQWIRTEDPKRVREYFPKDDLDCLGIIILVLKKKEIE